MEEPTDDFLFYTHQVSPELDKMNTRLITRPGFEFIMNSRVQEAYLKGKLEGLHEASETMTELLT